MKTVTNLLISATLGTLALCGSARALEVLEPGYIVEEYVAYSCPEIQYEPRGITFDPHGNLYLSQWGDYYSYEGAIYRISPDKSVAKWVEGLGTPRRMAWVDGTDYGEYLYVADCTPREILRIDLDGTVSTFARVGTGPHCLALDRTGNYGGYMYTATRARDHTYCVNTDGSVTMFSDFPGWTDGGGPLDIDFDRGRNYGGLMYMATDFSYTPDISGLFALDTNGNATRFAPDIVTACNVEIDPFGVFGGKLFVSGKCDFDHPYYTIWRVDPTGETTDFAVGTIGETDLLTFTFGPDGAMYVPEYSSQEQTVIIRRIYRVARPSQWTEPVPVTEVNSNFAEEWSPFLSFDGLTLYFARVRSDTFYYGRIFEAIRQEPSGPFITVREISGALNSAPGHMLFPWVSPDSLRMYYHNEEGGRFMLKLAERASINDPWPEGRSISELNHLSRQVQAPRLTADELTIFFNAYEVPGGQGGYDIWMATRPDNEFQFAEIRNLQEINSASSEGGPCVSPDGLTIMFASNRNGRFQLFMATRTSLEEPFDNLQHLSVFDTPGGDSYHPFLTSDGRALYFMRQWGNDRSTRDIWVSYFLDISEVDTYYVDAVHGNDLNSGFRPETAFATVQKGIDAAQDGDTVLVYPGVYTEEVWFRGKAITVQSTTDAAVMQNPDDFAVSFYCGEGPDSILRNFVITNSFIGVFIAGSSPTISNLTVVDNKYGIEAYAGSEPDLTNCIFWNNPGGDLFGCEAHYSCMEQQGAGQENLDANPLFVDPDKGDYHLRSERGRYWPEHDVWVLDDVTSPCIDAGDPAADYSKEPEPNGGRINMGAYGGTAYASMSEWPVTGDVNRDGTIDISDLISLIENWLASVDWER